MKTLISNWLGSLFKFNDLHFWMLLGRDDDEKKWNWDFMVRPESLSNS